MASLTSLRQGPGGAQATGPSAQHAPSHVTAVRRAGPPGKGHRGWAARLSSPSSRSHTTASSRVSAMGNCHALEQLMNCKFPRQLTRTLCFTEY